MKELYSDKRIFVAVKPCGVLSTDEEGGMPQIIRNYLGDEKACVRTVHRLDQVVSGVMVFARSRAAASILSEQVRNGTMDKEYLAVVHGTLSEKQGEFRDLLGRDKATKTTYVADAPGKDVREAILQYKVVSEKDNMSLLKITLITGRTHQIRVQCSSRGFPLVGDKKYGKGEECDIALFSHRLRFFHPETNHPVEFFAEPPDAYPWNIFS